MLSFERIGKGKTVVLETMPQNSDLYAEWDDGDSEGDRDIDVQYEKYIFRKVLFFIGSLVAIFLVAGYVVTYGQMNTSMSEAYSIIWTLWSEDTGTPFPYFRSTMLSWPS